jgi:hypothetical protein
VEYESLFGGESQPGQVPLHRNRQRLMPPVKSTPGEFTRLSRVILAKNPDDSVPTHTKGHEGNLLVGTQIRSLRMSGALDGALDVPATSHPLCHFVPLSDCSGWF